MVQAGCVRHGYFALTVHALLPKGTEEGEKAIRFPITCSGELSGQFHLTREPLPKT